jgi:hypothetical protein
MEGRPNPASSLTAKPPVAQYHCMFQWEKLPVKEGPTTFLQGVNLAPGRVFGFL